MSLKYGGIAHGRVVGRLPALEAALEGPADKVHWVSGPPGAGMTTALASVAAGPRALMWEVPALEGPALMRDLDRLIGAVLGPIPSAPAALDPLSFRADDAWWMQRFQDVFQALAARGRGGIWIVDGLHTLRGAGRNLPDLLLRAWASLGRKETHLVVSEHDPPAGWTSTSTEGEGVLEFSGVLPVTIVRHSLEPQLPYRVAAHRLGARTADEALVRWSVFGGAPRFQPHTEARVRGSTRDLVIRRVLHPSGDLFDAPIFALGARVQAPARYLGILMALARGERRWGDMARLAGVQTGNQLAPYLRKLEADGWIRVLSPLDGRAGGRQRRYEIVDPFIEFWMAHVFPWRSLLRQMEPARFYSERIHAALPGVVSRGLERMALAYMRHHASETLPAAPRLVGGLWAEGVEIPVAARLANGQVCYGLIGHVGQRFDESLYMQLASAMEVVRWGMGREARAPIFFLPGPAEEGLRRQVARNPLARILTPAELFGLDKAPH